MKVRGRVAAVTGAAGGIGAAVATRLLEAGARVAVTDRDPERLEATVAALAGRFPEAVLGVPGDAADEGHLQALLASAEEQLGRVDLFFANAGVGSGVGLEQSDEVWQQALEVNLMAHVRAARLLVPRWLEQGEGYFVSTASAAGLLTQIGSATYSASKHAAVGFAEWLSVTYGDRGIRVSCLCPMGVNTAMLAGGAASPDAVAVSAARAVTGAGQVLEAEEVADVVLAALEEEQFLILPHPEVREFVRRKADDPDRWIRGMRRYRKSLADS